MALLSRSAVSQHRRKVKTPFAALAFAFPAAHDFALDMQPFQLLLASHYAGCGALADGHPRGGPEDVAEHAVLNFLPFHHSMRLMVIVPVSRSVVDDQRIPLERSGRSLVHTTVRMVLAFLIGNDSSSPTFILRIESVVLFVAMFEVVLKTRRISRHGRVEFTIDCC